MAVTRRELLQIAGREAILLGLAACGMPVTRTSEPAAQGTGLRKKDSETPTIIPRETPSVIITTITPTVSVAPTVIPPPTRERIVVPTPENQMEKTIKKFAQPFWEKAEKKREDKRKKDKEWSHRADETLNKRRVNFLIFAFGKSVEPPNPNLLDVGTHTIISIDIDTGQIDIISFTHDIWDPGIDKYKNVFGQKNSASKIDQAYFVGKNKGGETEGFRLMGKEIEEMTGLSMDYQIAFQDDEVMSDLIDGVFGSLEVDVPQSFEVLGYYYKGKKYGDGKFEARRQMMNGERVTQFIKTVPKVPGDYDKSLEHNVRKKIILEAMFKAFMKKKDDKIFQGKALAFLGLDLVQGKIAHDFAWDLTIEVAKGIFSEESNLTVAGKENNTLQFPSFRSSTYMVDPKHGNGGVTWVLADAGDDLRIGKIGNPITKQLVAAGVFPTRIDAFGNLAIDMEIPIGANPYGDLADDYWKSTRELIRKTLSQPSSRNYFSPSPLEI